MLDRDKPQHRRAGHSKDLRSLPNYAHYSNMFCKASTSQTWPVSCRPLLLLHVNVNSNTCVSREELRAASQLLTCSTETSRTTGNSVADRTTHITKVNHQKSALWLAFHRNSGEEIRCSVHLHQRHLNRITTL